MSEKIRRKKEKPGKTLRALALGAELLAGSAAVHAAISREPGHTEQQDTHYKDFRRSEDVSDRYGQTPESMVLAQQYAELEPELPINDAALNSSLAADAGINHIEKSPLQIMRERQAQAKVLAKKAHENWKREQAKKHKK